MGKRESYLEGEDSCAHFDCWLLLVIALKGIEILMIGPHLEPVLNLL